MPCITPSIQSSNCNITSRMYSQRHGSAASLALSGTNAQVALSAYCALIRAERVSQWLTATWIAQSAWFNWYDDLLSSRDEVWVTPQGVVAAKVHLITGLHPSTGCRAVCERCHHQQPSGSGILRQEEADSLDLSLAHCPELAVLPVAGHASVQSTS